MGSDLDLEINVSLKTFLPHYNSFAFVTLYIFLFEKI